VANGVDINVSKFQNCSEGKGEGEKGEGEKGEGEKGEGEKGEGEKGEGEKGEGEKGEGEKGEGEKGEGEKRWDRAKLRDDDFVCYMDRERSKDVWGETFETLLALMKNLRPGGTQQSDGASI
jgi:hypothetical protein